MTPTAIMQRRYSTKAFDPARKISAADWQELENVMRLSASSVNSQPWHFLVLESDDAKQRFARAGTDDKYAFNSPKITNASHVVLFCTRSTLDDDYLNHLLDTEASDGRFKKDDEFSERMDGARRLFIDLHRHDLKDLQHWMDKQVYLNYGSLLYAASSLNIDAVPLEGIDPVALDAEFGLREKGFNALVAVSLGYRAADDFNAELPKSRLPADEIFTRL